VPRVIANPLRLARQVLILTGQDARVARRALASKPLKKLAKGKARPAPRKPAPAPAKPAPKARRRPSIKERGDLIDAIADKIGSIRLPGKLRKGERRRGGEYDGFPAAYRALPPHYRKALFAKAPGGLQPDVVASYAHEMGVLREPYASDLWVGIVEAVAKRRGATEQERDEHRRMSRQARDARLEAEMLCAEARGHGPACDSLPASVVRAIRRAHEGKTRRRSRPNQPF